MVLIRNWEFVIVILRYWDIKVERLTTHNKSSGVNARNS